MLSPIKISPFASNSNAIVTNFSIEHSFLLDGVNEYFSVPNADLVNILSGNTCKFSISFLFYCTDLTSIRTLFSNWTTAPQSILIYTNSSGTIYFAQRYTSVSKTLVSNTGVILVNSWNLVTITFDYSLTGLIRGKIFCNGSDVTISSSLDVGFDVPTAVYNLESYNNSNYFKGYRCFDSVENIPMTLAQHQALYNGGKPLNPQTYFGVNNKLFFNADNSGSTAQFTVTDSLNGISSTSVNLEDADKTTTTPY